jgi:hypothetical protein
VKRGRPVKDFLRKVGRVAVEVDHKTTATNDLSAIFPFKTDVTTPVDRTVADAGSSVRRLGVVSLL